MPTPADVIAAILANPRNDALLDLLAKLQLPQAMLTAGCLFQAVWNLEAGQPPDWGVKDYDIAYFDEDLSWEAEDRVIRQVEAACVRRGLDVLVEVRNQARVHLWYEQRFGYPGVPLQRVTDGIDRYLISATCLGLEAASGRLYSTHGLDDLGAGILRLNPCNPQPDLFRRKVVSYRQRWPWLRVVD